MRRNFLLMYSLDDMPAFRELLLRERPNVLLIGAMSLCMPGAIECAKLARAVLGDDLLIVLGGRHPTETIYLWSGKARTPADVLHHRASPVQLMRAAKIPPCFDVVISGDGEYVIAAIGEIVAARDGPISGEALARTIDPQTPGDWILSFPSDSGEVVSSGHPIDYDELPPLASLYGVSAAFDVFDGRRTAHVFSDTGRGCVYDCDFCSERRSVTGGIKDPRGAPRRLFRQMEDAVNVINSDTPGRGASAFVEDSVLLAGSPRSIDELCNLLERSPLDIRFGAQLTIDQILTRKAQLLRLAASGMSYIFIGLETFDPEEIGGMSKDLGGRHGSWQSRFRNALDILSEARIACGCALLFGLGEPHRSRIALLDAVIAERRMRRSPVTLSANWAVQHPLRNTTTESTYDYLEWGTPEGPFLDLFHRFGEASLSYPLPGVSPPTLNEVKEIVAKMDEFESYGHFPLSFPSAC